MVQVQLNVDNEVKAVADALGLLIADLKAKKSINMIIADVLPGVISAISSYQTVGAEMNSVDNQVYVAKVIAQALEG